jgi:hypothetical protein
MAAIELDPVLENKRLNLRTLNKEGFAGHSNYE